MATTTIPWSDGSGDNIYLTYPSASGNQTVSVSSDANTGAARSKVVTFTAGNVSQTLTVQQAAGREPLPAEDGRIWVYYDVTSTSEPTRIFYNNTTGNLGNTMLVNGESIPTANYFQFLRTGLNLVQFNLKADATSILANQWRNIPTAKRIFIPNIITSLGNYCLYQTNFEYVVFRSTMPATRGNNTMGGTFKIYVPYSADHSVLQSYKTAWSSYQGRIYELNADGSVPE